ncbi:MAG TPA: hypothetical protein VFF49_02380 [Thermodesulfobacteriota bacterium]|nr:hypothetical protein [Thermodesulfobacteriota bacterium]
MPRKKKPVETIKIEGLSSETVKEFEPKENSEKDDALWERYFKGSPNLLKLPTKKDELLDFSKEQSNEVVRVGTPVYTGVPTPVYQSEDKRIAKEPKPREEYVSLDATHTAMEAKVYSVIYRETIVKGNEPQHFGASRLMSLTGIGSDKTIRKAIKSLIAKKSIILIDPCPNHPLGSVYLACPPKEIYMARKKAGIKIHTQTKKIIASNDTVSTGVRTVVDTTVYTTVSTPVKNTPVTPVECTPVTPVRSTGAPGAIPYIYKNYLNSDDSIKNIESSSKSSSITDETDDSVFNHRVYIISLYEKYTGNQWRVGDDEFYENRALENVIPDTIEAAIIASVLRSKTKINSFTYCEGAVSEFQEHLPPGYLSYLRAKWLKEKHKGAQGETAITKNEYESLKKEIRRMVNFTRQVRVGGDYATSLEDDVKANCNIENIPFDELIYKEITEESEYGHKDPQ